MLHRRAIPGQRRAAEEAEPALDEEQAIQRFEGHVFLTNANEILLCRWAAPPRPRHPLSNLAHIPSRGSQQVLPQFSQRPFAKTINATMSGPVIGSSTPHEMTVIQNTVIPIACKRSLRRRQDGHS
jgi:hypothetical protein